MSDTVFFDTEPLIEGRTAKLTYKGKLLEDNSNDIYIHYGYGLLWNSLQEIKMDKIEDHYETNITLSSADDLNFCFRDSNNNWDNNDAKNYCAPISKAEVTVVKIDTTALEMPRLKAGYRLMKKIKIAFYKTITFLSKTFTGEWKKKAKNL